MDNLGGKIRELRRSKKRTLDELASECGLSVGFLSRVERSVSSLSIASLESIGKALGISAGELLATENVEDGAEKRKSRVFPVDQQWHLMIPNLSMSYVDLTGRMREWPFEVLINQFPTGYNHPMVKHTSEEFGYVLEGNITLLAEKEKYILGKGDCYFIAPETLHTYRTKVGERTSILMVSTEKFLE